MDPYEKLGLAIKLAVNLQVLEYRTETSMRVVEIWHHNTILWRMAVSEKVLTEAQSYSVLFDEATAAIERNYVHIVNDIDWRYYLNSYLEEFIREELDNRFQTLLWSEKEFRAQYGLPNKEA